MTNGFDKLLRESLAADAAADPGAECLDAALVAGWFDGTLSHAERTAVEAHAASCARCQATIAALVRTDRPSPRVWWRAPAMRWLVPVAVAAAVSLVVGIGALRTGDAGRPATTGASYARFESPAPAPAASAGPATAERPSPAPAGQAAAADATAKPTTSSAAASASEKASARRDQEVTARALRAEAPPVPMLPIEPAREQARAAALPQAPGAGVPTAAPAQAAAPPAGAAASAPAAVGGMAPITAPASDSMEQLRARSGADSLALSAVAGRSGARAPLILSPDPSVVWRISGSGQVERSVTGGVTWQTQTTGVSAVLTAGVAPSANVCWLVGWRGVVLKTSDGGQTWTRVPFPEEVNLLAVVADDDKVASVTAAGGRQLHTTDGGGSWK
jgi:hypothetical protein